MELIKKIRNLLFIFVIFGAATAYLDYTRIIDGEIPVFCKKTYNEKEKLETFRGLFYVAERTVKRSTREKLELSSNIKYKFLNQTLNIKVKHPKEEQEYVIYITPTIECPSPSKLYFELEDKKVYIDCIASIRLKEQNEKESKDLSTVLEESPNKLDDIINKLTFMGIDGDKSTEKYETINENFSNQKLYVYKCHKSDVKDVYITLNSKKEDNHCTKKNDSLPKEQE